MIKEFNYKKLGNNIRTAREAINMTQEVLATSCNMHPSRIGYIERGQKEPSLRLLNKISVIVGISVESLVKGCGAI